MKSYQERGLPRMIGEIPPGKFRVVAYYDGDELGDYPGLHEDCLSFEAALDFIHRQGTRLGEKWFVFNDKGECVYPAA